MTIAVIVAQFVGQLSMNPTVGGLTPASPDSWPHVEVSLQDTEPRTPGTLNVCRQRIFVLQNI